MLCFHGFSGHAEELHPRHRHLLQHCGFSPLLCLLCFDRSVCPGQCGNRGPDETPGGEQQGSQGGGGAGGRAGTGAPDGRRGYGSKVTPAPPSGTGNGQVEFWGFPLEVHWRWGHGAGKGRSYGLTHCRYNQRLCKYQSRTPLTPGAPIGGKCSFGSFLWFVCSLYKVCVGLGFGAGIPWLYCDFRIFVCLYCHVLYSSHSHVF